MGEGRRERDKGREEIGRGKKGEGKRQDKRKRQEKGKVKKKLEKEKERLRRGTSEPGDIVLIL